MSAGPRFNPSSGNLRFHKTCGAAKKKKECLLIKSLFYLKIGKYMHDRDFIEIVRNNKHTV